MLFIDMETPNRIRVQGNGRVLRDDPETANYFGADMIVRVAVTSCFLNCVPLIHKHQRVSESPYVPDAAHEQP